MSKKFVASLMGWLIVSFFIMSSVWAAANKDKTPIKKESKAQTAWSVPKKIQVTKAQLRPGWITLEEHDQTREKLMRSELETKSVYQAVTGVMEDVPFFQSGVLGIEPAPENFYVAGTSYYDINANDRNPRQIAIPKTNRNVAIAWAKSSSANLVPRNWFASLWIGASDSIQYVITEQAVTNVVGRGGFGGVTYLPRSGRMVIYSHHAETPRGTFLAIEDAPGTFGLSDEIGVPDSLAGNATDLMGIWPSAAGGFLIDTPADLDGDGDITSDTVETVHVFSTEGILAGGEVKHYIYARGIMRFNDSLKFMGFNGNLGVSADTGTQIVPVVVTSKVSPKVALIYTAERWCEYEPSSCSDVYYIESTSGGNDLFTGGTTWSFPAGTNITMFDSADATRATGDLMGVYDDSDELVISWTQSVDWDLVTGGSSRESDIYVWAADFGARKSQDGNYTKLPAGLIAGGPGRTLAWPHIGVHDGTTTSSRKGYLYMTYARYGNNTDTFSDYSYDNQINGEVYITASTNGGKSWSAAINATNSKSPACPAPVSGSGVGTCFGVSYVSCAERVDDTIYIAYMTDENSGDVIGDNALAKRTKNEVYFMKYPAFTPVPTKQISVTPANFIQDPDSAVNDTGIFLVQNIGNADLKVDSIREGNPATWLKFNDTDTAGFTILETGADVVITFIVNDSGLADGAYHDTLLVYSNAANYPLVEVPVILVVDNIDDYLKPKWVELATGPVTLTSGHMNLLVSNVGNIGNTVDTGGMYRIVTTDSTDTTGSVYDASKFLAVKLNNVDGDTASGRFMFGQEFMLPLTDITVKDTAFVSHHIAGTRVTLDSGTWRHTNQFYYAVAFPSKAIDYGIVYPGPWFRFKFREQLWIKKTGMDRYRVVWHWTVIKGNPPSWWVNTPAFATTENLYLGLAGDLDVFSDESDRTASDNWGRTAPGTGVAWQQGAKRGPTYAVDSLLVRNGHYGYMAFLDKDSTSAVDPYAMHIVSNPSYIYPNSGYDDGELYRIAADNAVDTTSDTAITCTFADTVPCPTTGPVPADTDTLICGIMTIIRKDSIFCSSADSVIGYHLDSDAITVGPAGTFKYFNSLEEDGDSMPTDLNMVMTFAKLTNPYPETTDIVCLVGIVNSGDSSFPAMAAMAPDSAKNKPDSVGCQNMAKAINDARKSLLVGGANDTLLGLVAKLSCLFGCTAKPGDANNSGTYTLGDAIAIVNYVFSKVGCTPLPTCWLSGLACRGDWNGTNTVTLGDAIRCVNYVFNKVGGPWNPIPTGVTACCLP